jgi:hypothetical protein
MRDLAMRVREYYDQAADPVTADEIFCRLVAEPQPAPRRRRPVWVVAGAAALVLILIGGVGLLRVLRDDAVVTDEPMPTTTLPTVTVAPVDSATMITPDLPVQIVNSVALAQDQSPAVLYMVEPQDRAALIICSDPSCNSFVESLVYEFATFGNVSDLAIGPDGLPVFAFSDFDEGTLTTEAGIVHCSDVGCSNSSVEIFEFDSEGMAPTLALDLQGLPAAIFTDWSDDGQVGTYVFVRCQDARCSDYTVSTIADAGGPPVLTFDKSGKPLVGFSRNERDGSTAHLVMVTCSDSACSEGGSETLVVESPVNAHSIDMALGPDETPTFVFGEPKLYIAHCRQPSCATGADVSAISLDVEMSNAIEIGADGLPIIAYTVLAPPSVRELRVASCADATCSEGTIEVVASHSWMPGMDMTLASSDNPVIVHQAETAMRITICGDAACAVASERHLAWGQAEFQIPESTVPDVLGWTQMESLAGGVSPTGVRASATGSEGTIVVGTHDGKPTAWITPDGLTWTEFTIASEGEVFDVAAGGPGFVVVGSTCSDLALSTRDTPPCDPAIWTSNDGASTWTLTSTTDQFGGCSSLTAPSEFGCQTWADDVLLTDVGFVAAGYDVIDGVEPWQGVIWTSSDGVAWERSAVASVDGQPTTPAGRPPYPELVADAPWQGGLYGLGTRCSGQGASLTCQPFGWISSDGMTWEPVDLDPLDFGASDHAQLIEDGLHLVSGDFGLLALGSNIDPTTWDETPMMFLSVDGEQWDPFRLDPEMSGTNTLVSLGDRVMAFGVGGVWVWTPDTMDS